MDLIHAAHFRLRVTHSEKREILALLGITDKKIAKNIRRLELEAK